MRIFEGLGADLKMACRRLLATPMFTIFAIVSLAVGVGVTTTAYSVVERLFWSWTHLAIPRPDGIVLVVQPQFGRVGPAMLSAPDFEDLRSAQTSFDRLAASAPIYPAVAEPATTEVQPGEAVDGSYFPLLGIRAAVGRLIDFQDNKQAMPVVVLSHHLWQSRFASDPDIVGQTVRLSGRPFEVIGVASEGFAGPIGGAVTPRGSRLWVPLHAGEAFGLASATSRPERQRRRFTTIGHLRFGITEQRAATEVAALAGRLDAAYPMPTNLKEPYPTRRAWTVRPIDSVTAEQSMASRIGLLVFGLVVLVLLVACTNLANLVLARGTMRQHELAVRSALGASRWRLVREQCSESTLLAAGGAAVAIAVMRVLTWALNVEVPIAAGWLVSLQPRVNSVAVLMAGGALLLSLIVFGLEPALELTRRKGVRDDLEAGGGTPTIPRARRQRTLLRWQAAISAGFFIIASLCVRQVIADAQHDSGVDVDRMAVAGVDFHLLRFDEARARLAARRVLDQARREPGVQAAAISTGLPFGTVMVPWAEISTTDKPLTPGRDNEGASLIAATPGFFQATGIKILRGRVFDERDDATAPPVIVVSRTTARKMFGTVDAVGRQLLLKIDFMGAKPEQPVKTATVIGIAEDSDTTFFLFRHGNTAIFAPFAQEYSPVVTLVARASNPTAALAALRAAVRKADPELAIERSGTGRGMLTGMYAMLRALGVGSLALGAISLLLAMVGLYGVQSHVVVHRSREIGVRMSLGATAGQVKRMVLKDGYRPVLEGLAIGLFIGLAGRAIIRSLYVGPMAIIDPWMLAIAPIALIGAAFWACYLPARRASRVDPNVALRHL